MYVFCLEVFMELNFKYFLMRGLYYTHLLRVLIFKILNINRGMSVIE